jgi:hypothetical protein
LARIRAAPCSGEGAAPRGVQPRVRAAAGVVVEGIVVEGVVGVGVVVRVGVHLRLRAGIVTFFIDDINIEIKLIA